MILMDYHLPLFRGKDYIGSLVETYQVSKLLEDRPEGNGCDGSAPCPGRAGSRRVARTQS